MKIEKKSNSNEKVIIFDSGALISFSMNGITDMIKSLKKIFNGKFLITENVKAEVIDNPLKIKRFELEALKIRNLLEENIIELPSSLNISPSEINQKTDEILNAVNSLFETNGRNIHILDKGEASCLALSEILNVKNLKNIIVIDERTTRILVENSKDLKNFLEKKLHIKIKTKSNHLENFRNFKIIRSTELVYVAYKKGITGLKDENLLNALLYALKSKGAAISGAEIEEIKRVAGKS